MSGWRAALRLVGLGWYIGICVFLGLWGGLWLDTRFDTKPILLFIGLFLGLVVAFCGVYRMIKGSLYDNQ
ncbi:MAG: AtpZ/AtpI family protein, partial [Armatimonadetes bacterium]|nr:AtpZ/AtpI family protein [Armatimonadota bacterium]